MSATLEYEIRIAKVGGVERPDDQSAYVLTKMGLNPGSTYTDPSVPLVFYPR
ncbi:MAG TPA: hypothetical protein VLJ59_02065 [Mycobacteriales bacterium]|nr:hypothetical protein [Mycobacteriales bacterium]